MFSQIKIIFIFIGIIFFIPIISDVQSEDVVINRVETLNLYVSSAQNISVANIMDVYSRVSFQLNFTDSSINYGQWGSGSPLSNGFDLYYIMKGEEVSLFGEFIQTLGDFGSICYDVNILDSGAVNDHYLHCQFSFAKFSEVGLDNRSGLITNLFFLIQDNMQTGINGLTAKFEGYDIIGETNDKTQIIIADKRTYFGFITPDLMFLFTLMILAGFMGGVVIWILKD